MPLKDYYKLLDLPPHATLNEIKQAYRQLALTHHPDKNQDDQYAISQFNEIKEAYEVLTNPLRKEQWLQERWYQQSIGNKKTSLVVTPVNILRQAIELEQYVSKLDIHRMNHEGLQNYISELLSDSTIDKLLSFKEEEIKRQIIRTLLKSSRPLKYSILTSLLPRLNRLAADDPPSLQSIRLFSREQRNQVLWERYKVLLVVVVSILICVLIFLTSK